MNTRNVILFTRSPRLGMVKRRLSRDIGMSDAWIFYRRNVRVISKRLALDPRWKLWLAVTPDTFEGNEPFWPNYIPTIRQGSGDIGVRMYRCLSIFQTHPTILIGTDIPDITADLIWQAFEKFKGKDAIFFVFVGRGTCEPEIRTFAMTQKIRVLLRKRRIPPPPEIPKAPLWQAKHGGHARTTLSLCPRSAATATPRSTATQAELRGEGLARCAASRDCKRRQRRCKGGCGH